MVKQVSKLVYVYETAILKLQYLGMDVNTNDCLELLLVATMWAHLVLRHLESAAAAATLAGCFWKSHAFHGVKLCWVILI